MTRTRKTKTPRVIAQHLPIFMVFVGLVVAQTRGAITRSEWDGAGDHTLTSGPRLFLPAVAYDSGGYTANSVAVADLNDDGKPDLVVGNKCANNGCQGSRGSVGILLGNGDGSFQAAVAYDSGSASDVGAVAIADLNGDHKPDLVVINESSSAVAVLLGNGNGTFQPAVTHSSGGMTPTSVAVADVNGDGKLDILVTNACGDPDCDGSVGVLLGNGNGTFQPAVTYPSGGITATSIAVADVNHDGKPDLLVANDCAGTCSEIKGAVAVLLGNGNATFQPALSYDSGGTHANGVTAADVNGDGNTDLLVSNLVQNTVGVLLGNGNGTFQPAVTYSSDPGSNASVVASVGVADVNGDGKPDLLVVNDSLGGDGNNGGAVALLVGNGDGTFQSAVNYPSGGYIALRLAVADLNGDGRPDLLIANECSFNSLDCGGPINKTRGIVGVLLNNAGAPPTTTAVVSNVNPAAIEWLVTYTATVTSQSGVPQGTVLFQDGAAPIAMVPLTGNQATFSATYAVKGTHPITATYSGELNVTAGSASDVLTEIILKPKPTSSQLTTSGSPSRVGQPVTFTATITSTYGAIPNGELVTFFDGTIAIGTGATVSGVAKFTTSSLTAKVHTIKATYAGDAAFKPSTGSVTQVVEKYPTVTSLTSNPNPSQFGQTVTFTVHVTSTGPAPTGKVKFLDGTSAIGSAALNGSGVAKLTKSTLAVGTHPITAQYAGDAVSDKSTSSVVNQVVQ
ncbi:MAG TPA: FG-GAP-like repeat-containing protein [Terriglobales bacterium]|jgi:hypothetical protein|nr:FG-GAP-like repeat-containing protein [Terriglobales bacterium]